LPEKPFVRSSFSAGEKRGILRGITRNLWRGA
jgi:hypothetical protein